MLARPEINSKEHVLLWLGSKPQDETFHYFNWEQCACGQYAREHLGEDTFGHWSHIPTLSNLNSLLGSLYKDREVGKRLTWGEAYEAASKAWGETNEK